MNLKISAASGSLLAWVLPGTFNTPPTFSQQLLDAWKRKTLAGALINTGARFFCATTAPGAQLIQEGLLVFGFQGAGASALVLAFEQRLDPALDEGADVAEYGSSCSGVIISPKIELNVVTSGWAWGTWVMFTPMIPP